jgi:hypothetical protein
MTIFQPGDFIIRIDNEEMVGEILSIEDDFVKHTCVPEQFIWNKTSDINFSQTYKLHPENDRLKKLRLFK